jgi:MFS family permease
MGLSFMGLSYIMLTYAWNYWIILLSMCVCGIGMGMLMPNSTLWVISMTKPERRPFFVGVFNTSSYGGKFFSPFIAVVFFWIVPKDNPRMLFELCAFLMFVVAVLAMWMNDRFKRINRVLYRKELRAEREMNNKIIEQEGLFATEPNEQQA